jgi:hypothetical protein
VALPPGVGGCVPVPAPPVRSSENVADSVSTELDTLLVLLGVCLCG